MAQNLSGAPGVSFNGEIRKSEISEAVLILFKRGDMMRADQQDNGAPLALRPLSYAVALAVLAMAGNAMAQQAPAQGSELQLDRVVVTANKRAQNLQDVPAAITVLSDATLQRENVKGIDDLPNLSPAVTVS